ncbi:MAG: hypothetical protein TEF_17250 [Rhizobiales bacterium NRL2]|jgi:hypothetical protein|nr:MAG: hypothetical protein TEF_17250 [Rhizobiales bacterium NRL2]
MPGERQGRLLKQLQNEMASMTSARTMDMCLANVEVNEPHYRNGRSLKELRDLGLGEGDSAVVIAAGPSLRRRDPVPTLVETGYRGATVITESALSHCLRQGLVPTCAVSVDPHPLRIVRWFGDPDLDDGRMAADDYFRRQEQDPSFADEKRKNDELLALMEEFGPRIHIALGTTSSPDVVKRVHEIGMQVFWFNPMLDDPDEPGSVTAELQRRNGLPCMNAGGNVGGACWMLAHAVLGKARVAVTGMDFGYYADTPLINTQYYYEALNLAGEAHVEDLYVDIYNPHLDEWYFTDPAYYWYRSAFIEMTDDADCETWNCSGGGTLFSDRINWAPLEKFLAEAG